MNTTLWSFSFNSRKSSFCMRGFVIDRRKMEEPKETVVKQETWIYSSIDRHNSRPLSLFVLSQLLCRARSLESGLYSIPTESHDHAELPLPCSSFFVFVALNISAFVNKIYTRDVKVVIFNHKYWMQNRNVLHAEVSSEVGLEYQRELPSCWLWWWT